MEIQHGGMMIPSRRKNAGAPLGGTGEFFIERPNVTDFVMRRQANLGKICGQERNVGKYRGQERNVGK
jgi:hypothetical protein